MRYVLIVLLLHLAAAPVRAEEPAFEGHDAAYWAGALADADVAVRREAAWALWSLGTAAAPAADALIAAFRAHDDRGFRRTLALALGQVGPAAKAALPDLRALLAGEEGSPVEVAFAICRLAPDHCAAALDRLVAEGCSDNRGQALWYLRELGPAATAALPALQAALEAADESRKENLRATIEAIRAK